MHERVSLKAGIPAFKKQFWTFSEQMHKCKENVKCT